MPLVSRSRLRSLAGGLGLAAATACVTTGEPRRLDGPVVGVEVGEGSGGGGPSFGPMVWGAGGGAASAATAPTGAPQDPQERPEQREARLRVQFGSNVLIGADGAVTKPYFLAGDLASTFLKLISEIEPGKPVIATKRGELPIPPAGTKVGGPQSRSILGRMLRGNEIEVTFVPEFEVLSGANLAEPPGAIGPTAVRGEPLNNKLLEAPAVALALITAKPSALAAFEAALDLFYTSIPQVEIGVNVVEFQTADALAFGVRGTGATSSNPVLTNLSSSQLVRSYSSVFPLTPPILGASPVGNLGRFALGGIHDSWELDMILEALEANNLADIVSSPRLVVRNGGVAAISTLTQVPFPKAKFNQLGAEVAVDIEFKPVGVRMNIIPVIAGTDSVILQIYADVSAITGFADTDPVTTPITSTRTAVTTVHLKNGHTLVIGGLSSKTRFETESKVPILGDIPLLGLLFRSTSVTHNDTTVQFHITPRIVEDRGLPELPENRFDRRDR